MCVILGYVQITFIQAILYVQCMSSQFFSREGEGSSVVWHLAMTSTKQETTVQDHFNQPTCSRWDIS